MLMIETEYSRKFEPSQNWASGWITSGFHCGNLSRSSNNSINPKGRDQLLNYGDLWLPSKWKSTFITRNWPWFHLNHLHEIFTNDNFTHWITIWFHILQASLEPTNFGEAKTAFLSIWIHIALRQQELKSPKHSSSDNEPHSCPALFYPHTLSHQLCFSIPRLLRSLSFSKVDPLWIAIPPRQIPMNLLTQFFRNEFLQSISILRPSYPHWSWKTQACRSWSS